MGEVRVWRASAAAFAAMTLLLSGCGGLSDKVSKPEASSAPPLKELGGCITASDATLIHHTGGGIVADVALFGSGDVTAIVTYETFRNVCTWLPLAKRLVAAGHQVLLYDQVQGGGEDQIPEMARLARQHGAQKIVLVGGSAGGQESIAAARIVDPPVVGVAVLAAAPGSMDSTDAAALTVPFLQVVAKNDDFVATDRDYDRAASKSPDHKLLIVEGSEHASLMFAGPAARQVLGALVAFVDKVGR